ncbi:E3 ubiquitin-protein ligase TRIM7-like [Podarcis raffonei]|uniref:E3 ubiquitin-protein ligase TRIM7-like n=1 Tax=Podarcis raffonei TaxID=65483 RepID=UPI0023298AE8|nr:E3 ubiquitin-protein ligase TRIM7-like [Podarcis raffonei]
MAAPAVGGGPVQSLCDEATCSICLDYFKDPVMIPECGHNFCRSCVIQCWGESEAEAFCPHCRETVQERRLIPNWPLQNVVEIAKKLSLQEGKEEGGKEKVCEKHQEPLKLFCKEDGAPICLVCDRSKEHVCHETIPLKEASKEYKGLMCRRLEILRRERERILAYQEDVKKECEDLLKLTEAERQKTAEKFRQLHQFIEEQEKCLLNEIEKVEKEIARKREEHLARLSKELSYVKRIIQEMQEKRQQPESEFLQDVRSTLQRYDKRQKLENPPTFPPELKKKTSRFCDIDQLLDSAMKKFQDSLSFREHLQQDNWSFGQQFQKANVTLDPDTADTRHILSEDRKSVRLGEKPRERYSDYCPPMLGREGFTAGKHFWEVNVENGRGWVVGVAVKSVSRDGSPLSPEGGIWAVQLKNGQHRICSSLNPLCLSLNGKLKRIRVTLDYEGGCVSFYNADSGTKLYTFSGAWFSGETLLPFFRVDTVSTHLEIC